MFRDQRHNGMNREMSLYVKKSYRHEKKKPRYEAERGELRMETKRQKRKRKARPQKWLSSLISPRT